MSVKNVFDWRGPSVFSSDVKMKQIASGGRGGQLASQRSADKLNEKKQVLAYSKGKESAKTEEA